MKSPAEMLMKILVNGGTVEDKGDIIGMSEDGALGCLIEPDKLMTFECDVKAFVQMAERIGRDELWLKLCAMQLKEK